MNEAVIIICLTCITSLVLSQPGALLTARELGEQLHRLAEVYDWCTEGCDTADLQEARVLLEALS